MSDAYVAAVPLARDSTPGAVADVYRLLLAAAVVWLSSLAMGNPIRGGVEVGTAAPLGDSEVYGEGLARAYRLESRAAKWPRIVVGPRLFATLQDVRDRRIEPTASIARDCCLLLRQDPDDRTVVDVLGWAMASLVGRSDLHEAFPKAHNHVRGQIRLHREAGDRKLVSRYETLLAYFDERAPLWRPEARIVVTTEVSKPTLQRAKRRIPDVCRDLGVHCCAPFEFIEALDFATGWRR